MKKSRTIFIRTGPEKSYFVIGSVSLILLRERRFSKVE